MRRREVNVTDQEKEELRCDVLLFIATSTEKDALREAARLAGFQFQRHTIEGVGRFYSLGTVGSTKVNAVATDMGPFSYGGSASRAIHFRIATGATAIIQLGMAFGVDPEGQRLGDVLVSTSLIPYDLREVRPIGTVSEVMPADEGNADTMGDDDDLEAPAAAAGPGAPMVVPTVTTAAPDQPYFVDYRYAKRHTAKESLLQLFRNEENRGQYDHRVYFGGLLSGGARIFSRRFLGELVRGVPPAEDGIVGGEMEGVGLLSVSPAAEPIWIVVKGISDFADENRDSVVAGARPVACANSARFVLRALAGA